MNLIVPPVLSVTGAATVLVRSCDQLSLECGYAGPTIAGVEAAGEKSS